MKLELRNSAIHLDGYVNAVGRESRQLRDMQGKFIEVIQPGTFAKSLEHRSNVGLMLNHQRDLKPIKFDLYEDNIGLRALIEIDDPEVVELAEKRKLQGFSFGFVVKGQQWDESGEIRKRTITDMDLQEVSILSVTPAYIATSIEMRDDECTLKEQRSESCEFEIDDSQKVLEQLHMRKQAFNFNFNRGVK